MEKFRASFWVFFNSFNDYFTNVFSNTRNAKLIMVKVLLLSGCKKEPNKLILQMYLGLSSEEFH